MRRRSLLVALCFVLTAGAGQALAQTDAADPLADPVVDGSYGFSIRPPRGWQIIRRRLPERDGVALLRMMRRISPAQTEEMVFRQTSTTRTIAMKDMLQRVADTLELKYSNVEILSQQEQPIAEQPGGVLSATLWREGSQWLRLEAIIELRPRVYFVLLYSGPANLRGSAEPLFYQVLASLELLADRIDEAKLRKALDDGVKLLDRIDAAHLKRALVPEQYLRIERGGRAIGFVAAFQGERTWEKHPGIEVRERGWTFEDDGRASRLQSNMFVSLDRRHEHWQTSVTTLVGARKDLPEHLDIALEEGLRVDDILLSNQQYQLAQPPTENPPLNLPETYVSRAVIRILPRLVPELAKEATYAFVSFDHVRGGLVTRVVEFKGESELPDGVAASGRVYRVDDREGLAAQPSSLYFDERGHVVLVVAGELRMTPTDAATIEKEFGRRVAESDSRMNELEREYAEAEERFRRRSKTAP